MEVQKCSNILDDYISIGLVLLRPLIKLQSHDEKYLLIESQYLAGYNRAQISIHYIRILEIVHCDRRQGS